MLPQDLKTNATESEGMEKIFHTNAREKKKKQKQYLDKIDFKTSNYSKIQKKSII